MLYQLFLSILDDEIYYRDGTYRKPDQIGSDWKQVDGKLKHISVGDDVVVGCNSDDEMYVRIGEFQVCASCSKPPPTSPPPLPLTKNISVGNVGFNADNRMLKKLQRRIFAHRTSFGPSCQKQSENLCSQT